MSFTGPVADVRIFWNLNGLSAVSEVLPHKHHHQPCRWPSPREACLLLAMGGTEAISLNLYNTPITPLLDYGDVIYDNLTAKSNHK